jgi:hypothetical protein
MGRSPFATALAETYRYDEDEVLAWRIIAGSVTDEKPQGERESVSFRELWELDAEDYEDVWVRLRLPNSRRDISMVSQLEQPVETVNADGSIERTYRNMDARRDIFMHLVEAWSVSSLPTKNEYERLAPWIYSWLDACVLDAIAKGMVGYQKKGDSSKPPRSSRGRSSRAAGSSTTS